MAARNLRIEAGMKHQGMRTARSERGSGAPELLVTALVVLILFIAASPFYRAAKAEAARQKAAQEKGRDEEPLPLRVMGQFEILRSMRGDIMGNGRQANQTPTRCN